MDVLRRKVSQRGTEGQGMPSVVRIANAAENTLASR